MNPYRDILHNGLWKQNPGIVQLLGLCPLLAMSNSVVNAVSLGLATVLVMSVSSGAVAALRSQIPFEIRIPVFILIIAALTTVVDFAFNAYIHDLYLVLGIFIPLIVTNCIVLARVEAFAAKTPVGESMLDGAAMGLGLTGVLGTLGAVREILGSGTLFSGIEMIVPGASALQILPADYPGFLVAILPPGAFFFLGCLIAVRAWLDERAAKKSQTPQAAAPADAAPSLPAAS